MKLKMLFREIFFFFLIANISYAQEGNNNFSNFWQEFSSTSNSAYSDTENWKLLSLVGLTSIFMFGTDMEMHEEFGLEHEGGPLGISKRMGKVGQIYDKPGPLYFTLGLAGSFYTAGHLFNDNRLIETTNMIMQSVVYTGIIATAAKLIIGRSRPYVKDKPLNFRPFNASFDSRYMSMPSGHTSSIFAIMTVIAKRSDSWYIKVPAYTFAASVAFQRINDQQHWLSDILVGGALGYMIADAVVYKKGILQDISVKPLINSNGLGLSLKW